MPFNVHTKKDINWKDEATKEAEWKKAKEFFENNPNEVKLHHQRKKKDHVSHESHSFVQVETENGSKILAVNDESLGAGALGKTKLAVDENGNLYVLKMQKGRDDIAENEAYFSKKAGASIASFDRAKNSEVKHYIAYNYFGEPLSSFLEREKINLTKEEQLDLAIKLFIEIDRLHKTNIAHRDTKPDNYTLELVDDKPKINAIDYGFSERFNQVPKLVQGTPLYIPNNIEFESNEVLDLYAGLRTVGFTSALFNLEVLMSRDLLNYYGQDAIVPREDLSENYILNDDLIDNNSNIHQIIAYAMWPESRLPENTHADDAACLFIFERNNLFYPENIEIISKNPIIKKQIIEQYINDPDSITNYFIHAKMTENNDKILKILEETGCQIDYKRLDRYYKVSI